jgi:hypothetical protein
MRPRLRKHSPSGILACSVFVLSVLTVATLVQTFAGADKTGPSATYSHGVLRVVIPCRAAHVGSGRLRVEVVDPEDRVVGQMERPGEVLKGSSQWKAELKLDKPLALEELVWHRLRYDFRYDDPKVENLQSVESISNILLLPVLRIVGQQTYLAGSKAAVRVIVTDSKGEVIPGRSSVRIDLEAPGKERRPLYKGRLNHRATTEAQFQFLEGLTGNYNLHYTVDTSLGTTEYTQGIRLQDKVGILLTTDKTI